MPVWLSVTLVGALTAAYVSHRLIQIARELAGDAGPKRLRRKWLLTAPYVALGLWTALQLIGIVEALCSVAVPGLVEQGGFVVVVLLGLLTIGYTAGSVVGDATAAWERVSVMRLQLILLVALFVLVFSFPFTSDQLADVLRAWGDLDDHTYARPLTGIAAALLLGAACRASTTRLLIPRDADDVPSEHTRWRFGTSAVLVAAALALLAAGLEAAAFLLATLGAVLALTRPAAPLAPANETTDERESLRRLAGTLGTAPMAILLVGIVGAATDSLLLPGARPGALVAWTLSVLVVFALLVARAQVPSGRSSATLRGGRSSLAGVAGFAVGLSFFVSAEIAAVLLVILAIPLAFRLFGEGAERGKRELWAASGATLGVGLAVYIEPVEASRGAGAFGLALIGLAGIVVLLHAAGSAGMRRVPIVRLRGGSSRTPVVLLVGAWLAVAYITAHETAHQAQTLATAKEPVAFATAVEQWLDREAQPAEGGPPGAIVPMLFVAASGGGSKAAYWTDLVLDCAFGAGLPRTETADECTESGRARNRRDRLFLTSSVSGGSVGIYHYVNQQLAGAKRAWVNATAGTELLSPTVAWGMFHDLPALLLGASTNPQRCQRPLRCAAHADRALIQEAAIEAASVRRPALAPRTRGLLDHLGPLLIFNGSSEFASRTFVLSRAKLAPPPWDSACAGSASEPLPAAIDGHDVLIRRDLPIVTAAMLSARFPLLEPPGRLGVTKNDVVDGVCDPPPTLDAAMMRDGGLMENTGLLTIVNLLPAVQRAITRWQRDKEHPERRRVRVRPIVLSIDDDVPKLNQDGRLRRGWLAALGASSNRTARARGRLNGRLQNVCYMRISPTPHAGAQAATGWEISETSRRADLGASLRQRTAGARATLLRLRRMLDGTGPCPRTAAARAREAARTAASGEGGIRTLGGP